jgi:hypothetical protein
MKDLSGSCNRQVIADELAGFPDNSKASLFNGEDLELKSGPLRVGTYPRPPDPIAPYAQFGFEVVRKVR